MAALGAAKYVMVPIMICNDLYELKRMENHLIKEWKPSLNQLDNLTGKSRTLNRLNKEQKIQIT